MHAQVSAAMDAHSKWKEKLQEAIETGTIDKSVDDIRVDNKCAFGHWLFGSEIPADVKNSENYQTVKQIHAEFHHIAARIAELAIHGDKEAAQNLLHDTEYTNATMKLTNALYYLDKLL
jgi:hypothetical protein